MIDNFNKLKYDNDILIKNSIGNIFKRLNDDYISKKENIDLSIKDFFICTNLEEYSDFLSIVILKNKLEWTTINSIFFSLYKKELYTIDYLIFNAIEEIYNVTNNNKFYKISIDYNKYFNVYYLSVISINYDNSFSIKLCCSLSNFNVLSYIANKLELILEKNIFYKMDRNTFDESRNKILNDLFSEIKINSDDYFVSKFNYDFSKLYEDQYNDFDYDDFMDDSLIDEDCYFEVNYYSILGIEKNASMDEIKNAYRKKAKEWHPDICKDKNAEEMFKKINKAFKVLKNEDKRKEYDEMIF